MKRAGFSIIELLVVVMVIGLLTSLVVPAARFGLEESRRVGCLGNLRQMATAAHLYAADHGGRFPHGTKFEQDGQLVIMHAWDYSTIRDWGAGGQMTVKPGLLWQHTDSGRIQQCPSFRGAANWMNDPYTGYNYNVSYVGHGAGETITTPIRVSQIINPSRCALFGDGEWEGGANKFMRSPLTAPGDAAFSGRYAGAQGFRHRGMSNVAFADGRAESWKERHTGPYPQIPDHTGFLSDDNSMYDLH